jgi:hypothetical protein
MDGIGRLEMSRFLAPPVIADHRTAPVNALGCLRVMFTVEDIRTRTRTAAADCLSTLCRPDAASRGVAFTRFNAAARQQTLVRPSGVPQQRHPLSSVAASYDEPRRMRALLLFHLYAGVRVAIRTSALMFCAIVAWVTLYASDPTAIVVGFAAAAFASRPVIENVVPFAGLALLLPAWAPARLSSGLNGWLRHLPFNNANNRRGLALALVTAQLPLILLLVILGLFAHGQRLPIAVPSIRWALVLTAGAIASMPVRHRYWVALLALTALAVALVGSGLYMAVSVILLIGTDVVAGPIRTTRRRTPRAARSLLNWRIAWRAIGAHMLWAYGVGLLALSAGRLFIVNNDLVGRPADAVARFAGAVASILCVSSLAKTLAVRRPIWALSRSFPWSATRRVAEDGAFLAAHTLPLVLLIGVQSRMAALQVLALLPCLSLLAAGHMRRIPERRNDILVFLGEGLLTASLLTLVPWTTLGWLLSAIPALSFSSEYERRQKVTCWSEFHHDDAGDSTVWSGR